MDGYEQYNWRERNTYGWSKILPISYIIALDTYWIGQFWSDDGLGNINTRTLKPKMQSHV